VNQLRHSFLTDAEREFGLEAARAAVSHGDSRTTRGYVAPDLRRAAAVAERLG
jgi:hypothetical protein